MAKQIVRIPITNVHSDGVYTGTIYVGAQRKPANVMIDTGSSCFVLDGNFYDPSNDSDVEITKIAQPLFYGSGSCIGAVVLTDIGVGAGRQSAIIKKVRTTVAYHKNPRGMFGGANGILGLAYSGQNAYSMPDLTWPPKYHSAKEIQKFPVTPEEPYFAQLVHAGNVANKFALCTKRSFVSYATKNPIKDPLNNGYLILGGGEESKDLYSGSFQSVRIVHDEFYNTNLKAIIVGNRDPISVPASTRVSEFSNSIVDSAANSLILQEDLFKAVVDRFSPGNRRKLVQTTLRLSDLDLAAWPDLTFVLEGITGDVRLTVKSDTYWQVNAPKGYATASLGKPGQSTTLGLPLINGYLTIFDRSAAKGLGAIKFASRL